MPLTLRKTLDRYFRNCDLSNGTQAEYRSTLNKWENWKSDIPINQLGRKEIAEFLDLVFVNATAKDGKNPGRTANKAREQLRAVMSWAWEQEIIDSLPRFPKSRKQRDVAGRHYLTKSELNAIYFATYQMKRPRGWDAPFEIGKYWRCAGRCDRSGFKAGSSAFGVSRRRSLATSISAPWWRCDLNSWVE